MLRLAKITAVDRLDASAAVAHRVLGDEYKPITVKTPDGLTISAQEWGNPAGPEILFIHGFSQSYLSFMRQVDSELAKVFRIVTYDLVRKIWQFRQAARPPRATATKAPGRSR